ncbi:glycosyltransferase family 4 protein [Ktedonospora formicarum]|uniref:Glycosyl transferase n=1 Tax=Ktedonospora formicarum TaxID=2778364 RepID=A0A8J3HS46_9CHLR|nr:glycosyltransferase family 4 protein [Ktedonospora formicarum]GHO42932.1 glycosyl transferase [Ktedonospora formicarum]
MDIVHIAPPWISIPPKNYGGTEIVLYNLIEEQIAQGHTVTLLAPGDASTSARLVSFLPQALIEEGVPWYAHLQAFYHLYRSVEYISGQSFDIAHLHLSSASDMYLLPLTQHLHLPHVMTLHSCFPFDRAGSWMGDGDKYYAHWLKTMPMVSISHQARKEALPDLDFLDVVHHGLPMHLFTPTVKRPDSYVAWLGRFVPEKGPHLAIKAARRAGVPLVLAGIVDHNVPNAVRYFQEQIEPEIDGEQIRYIGPVNHEQKVDLLSRARAFLNPITWEEPFGMVMIEAMALGCPVITFSRGAAPEVVRHGRSGFLVKDVDEMVACIERIEEFERATVRAHVEGHFSVQAMAEKYTHVYRRVIATHVRTRWSRAHAPSTLVPFPLTTTLPLRRDDLASAAHPPSVHFPTAETEVEPTP